MAVVGFTASCNTSGAASGTIASGGTFHLILLGAVTPGILLTTNTLKMACAGMSTITTSGNVIGTITSPKCGVSSKTLTLSFTATGSTQNHLTYTGTKYDLSSSTSTELVTSALVGNTSNTQANAGIINCTG